MLDLRPVFAVLVNHFPLRIDDLDIEYENSDYIIRWSYPCKSEAQCNDMYDLLEMIKPDLEKEDWEVRQTQDDTEFFGAELVSLDFGYQQQADTPKGFWQAFGSVNTYETPHNEMVMPTAEMLKYLLDIYDPEMTTRIAREFFGASQDVDFRSARATIKQALPGWKTRIFDFQKFEDNDRKYG